MTTYRERREARADRLESWAAGRQAKADAALTQAQQTADMIPFGQPMLTDHYSYRSDRNRRDRMQAGFARGYEHLDKARAMESRAANIRAQADRAIYSDDTDAIEQLEARIANLSAARDRIKAYNASCRKGSPDPSALDEAQRADLAAVLKHAPYQSKGGAFPSYALSNLSADIRRNQQRLDQLTAQATMPTSDLPPFPPVVAVAD